MVSNSIQSLMKKYNLRPKKRLGQHFLSAAPTARKIVNSLKMAPDDTVIEIGCGPGIMTGHIAEIAKKVLAVDVDSTILDIAREELASFGNIEWICEDILSTNLDRIVGRKKVLILGNLPYNISSQIIFWMIDNRVKISRAVIMLQKEVALRVCASPGGKDCGILSVLSQAFANCRKLFNVSANSFIPPPEVTSSVVEMNFEKIDYRIDDESCFRKIVKAAFGKRRKTIRNSLLGAINLKIAAADLDRALTEAGIDPRRRAETLGIKEFIRLASMLQ